MHSSTWQLGEADVASLANVVRGAEMREDLGETRSYVDEEDEDEQDAGRRQQLEKLREQLQNLNAANVMLSRYLNSMQDNISDILAENWSFKILIGCLSSKDRSSNALEQMISQRIAKDPSAAIPMLKNIHKSAAAQNPDQLEPETSKNESVFQNMVGLLMAQKQHGAPPSSAVAMTT